MGAKAQWLKNPRGRLQGQLHCALLCKIHSPWMFVKKKKPRKQTRNTRVHSRSSYKLGEFPTFPCLYLKQRSWKESAKGLEIFQQVWKVHDWEGPWPISKPAKPLPNPFPLGSPAFLFPAIDLIKKEKGIPWPLNLRSQCTTKTLCWSAKGKQNAVA